MASPPLSHYPLGWLPLWTALAARMPKLVNAVMGSRPGPWIARLGGVTRRRSLPAFHGRRAWRRGLAERAEGTAAVLVVDSFTQAFRPELAGAASRVLAEAGLSTQARGDVCCRLTWITTNQLAVARRALARTAAVLDASEGPIVVTEPSCGVAGNFGFEHDHYDVSTAVADQALRPRLEAAAPGTPVLADGFSCPMQIEQLVGDDRPGATHLTQLLDDPQP